jgi:catechol 2,3-dioxygenase-like lactoylglutathione lyase family enzyme
MTSDGVFGVFQITVITPNFDASLRFYMEGMGCTKALEWTETTVNGNRVQFNATLLAVGNGSHIELLPTSPDQPHVPTGIPIHHFTFATHDCAASYMRGLTAGGKAMRMNPEWDGSPAEVVVGKNELRARVAFLEGPAGEIVSLCQKL